MGLGYNQDDGLSFGAEIQLSLDSGLSILLDAQAYTDRIVSQRRFDVFTASVSYPFTFHSSILDTVVAPSLGVTWTGNLGFQDIQNSYHQLIGRDPVTLSYDDGDQQSFLPFPHRITAISLMHTFWVSADVTSSPHGRRRSAHQSSMPIMTS
jgi:hypothetical protein